MRVVVDPSVVASAAISRGGASRRLLLEFRGGAFELLSSPRLLEEVEALLERPALRRFVRRKEAAALVEFLRQESSVLEDPADDVPAVSDDPGDDYLVALARGGSARALVTADPHLVALGDKLPILTPTQFLLLLR